MTLRRRVALPLLLALPVSACGDGTPAFCEPLGRSADLDGLAEALAGDDLDAAGAEAQRLADLAEEAPTEVRADLEALAEAVVDIVELLEDEQEATDTGDGSSDVGAAQVERRRDDLNARFGELDRRSTRVTTWAARECGLELG